MPAAEKLNLAGDQSWLLENVLYPLAGGQEAFDDYFHIENGQVVLNDGVSREDLDNAGQGLIYDLVTSSDNYIYSAGVNGEDVAKLFQGTLKSNGKLNDQGKKISNLFSCRGNTSGCGVVVGTSGRPNGTYQPADLSNGDPVFAVIAYNERTAVTQTGVADAGQAAASSIGQVVPPVSIFLHESAENLAFRTQGTWDYPAAHGSAIQREANIRAALGFAGGWAGAYVNSTIPK